MTAGAECHASVTLGRGGRRPLACYRRVRPYWCDEAGLRRPDHRFGFRGSVSALRLTEKGYRVGVLEAGRRFADEDFAETSWDLHKFLWAPKLGCYGIQRIHPLKNVLILAFMWLLC